MHVFAYTCLQTFCIALYSNERIWVTQKKKFTLGSEEVLPVRLDYTSLTV